MQTTRDAECKRGTPGILRMFLGKTQRLTLIHQSNLVASRGPSCYTVTSGQARVGYILISVRVASVSAVGADKGNRLMVSSGKRKSALAALKYKRSNICCHVIT